MIEESNWNMKNTYFLARTWRLWVIASSAGLVIVLIMIVFMGNFSGKALDFILLAIIFGFLGALSYGMITSKIITTTEGIETRSFGVSVRASWDKVKGIDINPYGIVNLVFKESIYKNQLINSFLSPLAYDRNIQISPYIEDIATSNLLKDIAQFVPHSNVREFIAKNKRSTKTFQKVGTIGLYYLGFLSLWLLPTFALRRGAEYLEATGVQNANVVSYIISTSLLFGLFISGMSLLGYNAELENMNDDEITRRARAYYLIPLVVLLIGFFGGMIIWVILQSRSIVVERETDFALAAFFLGVISIRISGSIERLIFNDKDW